MTAIAQRAESPWLIGSGIDDPDRIRMRLFCFHYAGATASIFRSWQNAMPDAVEVFSVQLPGREYRFGEPLLTDSKRIAAALADELPPLLDKPYVFFGHSMGVLIGFDVVQILRARGLRQPEMLIASGRNSPRVRWRDAGFEKLPDDQFVDAMRDYHGTPEALLAEESLRDLWLPRLRADLTVSAAYDYVEERPLECPIEVLVGDEDSLVSEEGLRAWLSETTGGVRFTYYSGDHFFLHSAEELVLAKVRAELEGQLAQQRHSLRQG